MNLPLQLDRSAAMPLQDQLFEQLRQLILTGRLKPNSRIIATRFLAEQVGVSRRTVLFAYERLIAEGYLETQPAIGTFVSPTPPGQARPEAAHRGAPDLPRQAELHPAAFLGEVPRTPDRPHSVIDFSPLNYDTSHLLPAKVWLREMKDVLADDPCFATPAPAAGVDALRQVLSDHLAATRGILAAPEQIVIVSGRLHACSLIAHLFQRRGDRVVVESPGDEQIAGFFRARHAEVVGVPVDEHGLDISCLPEGAVSLAYVTPARQNPMGGTLLAARRAPLIEWARNAKAYLIEDDGDSDLRYQGAAPAPLITLDPYGLVFHLTSFDKRVGAGFRVACLVVPAEFADAVVAIKAFGTEGGQWLEQMVLANLLSNGEYDHHLRRLRKIYLERRDVLIEALTRHFPGAVLIGTESGTQLTWLLPEHLPPASELCAAAEAIGIHLSRPADADSRFHERALVLEFGGLEPDLLQQGVAALARAFGRLKARRSAEPGPESRPSQPLCPEDSSSTSS